MAHAGGDLTAKNILVVRDSHTQLVSHVFNPVCAPDLLCRVYLVYLDLGQSPDLISLLAQRERLINKCEVKWAHLC
jgi:hypothetical protein